MSTAESDTVAPTAATHQRIGLASASALYIAAVLGTGILVLPSLAADAAGPASVVAVAAVLVLSIPLAGTYAALAARYPDAGGVATFARLALGDTAARATGYWFFFGVGFGAPVVAALGGEYLVAATGTDRVLVPVIGAAFLLITYALAMVGLRVSGRVQLFLSALLVVVVVLVVASAGPATNIDHFSPFLPNGWAGVGLAVSLFVWAFAGWEAVTHIAGEFRNPRHTIPRATAIAVAVVGVLNAYLPAFGNLGASLGRDGHLPRWFAQGAEPGAVPRRALTVVLAQSLIYTAIFFVLQLPLETFILIHTSSMVSVYAVGMVAAVRLLDRFSVGWWMAVISVVLTTGLLLLAGAHLLVPAILALVAIAVTVIRKLRARV